MFHYQCQNCGEIHDGIRSAKSCCFGDYTSLNEDYEVPVARMRPRSHIPIEDMPYDELMNLRASMGDYEAAQWVYRNLK